MPYRFVLLNSFLLVLLVAASSCHDSPVEPGIALFSDALCYVKSSNGYWQIFTNNLLGTGAHNISSYAGDDEYPAWSPNGRYILFQRKVQLYGPMVYVYDLSKETYTNLTADGGLSSALPRWTPNGKVVCAYQSPVGSPTATYLMDPDGAKKRKIRDGAASAVYMYPDEYTFLYVDGTKIYKTDLDKTRTELVFDQETTLGEYVAVQGFNANTEELLVVCHPTMDSLGVIGAYSIKTRTVRALLNSESGYQFFQLVYSPDCSAIAVVEHSNEGEYLSVLQAGVKRRLVHIPGTITNVGECFSFNPMQFSPDGRYLAYSKMVFGSGQWVNWTDHLYVAEVSTGEERRIDKGYYPSWNSARSFINN